MDNKFLLTYSYLNEEGRKDTDYGWYENKEEIIQDINYMKKYVPKFEVNEAIEILQSRDIEIK